MLVDVTDEINELRRKRYMELVDVSMCKEEETMNDQGGWKVPYHGRCPRCSIAWH